MFLTHSFYPDIGGIESHSEMLATAFHNAGYTVHLLTWSKDKTGKRFPFTVSRDPTLIKLFELHNWADIIFENNPCLRLSLPVLIFRKPLIIVLHTWLTRKNGRLGFQDIIKHRWLKKANFVVACSHFVQKKCWPNAVVIKNPYNNTLFKADNDICKTIDFVFLGRLVSDKGADLAIRAVHKLRNEIKGKGFQANKILLTIIGGGPEMEALKELIIMLNLENVINFRGPLQGIELISCLNQHRYLLVPSKWEEPFGIVALEGMACGCIPIVADTGGLPEAVGNAGLIFSHGNVNALVSTVCNIIENDELSNRLRGEANIHLRNHYQEVVSEQYLKIIQKVVAIKVNENSSISSYRK